MRFCTFLFIHCIVILSPLTFFAEGLRDVKPPLQYPSLAGLIVTAIFILLILLLGVYLLKRLSRLRASQKEPELKPWEKALKDLTQLASEDLLKTGAFEEFYLKLSDVLRRYIEKQLNIKAPEMTTEEFLQYLKTSSALSKEQKETLKRFLESCDLVKFAKYAPDPNEAAQSFELAKAFIEETKPEDEE